MRYRATTGLLTAGVCLFVAATPAWADDSGTVDATVTVTGGGIAIAVPATADLGSGVPGVTGADVTAQLGTVTVTDLRGIPSASWVATVTSTAFTTGAASAGELIDAGAIDYWSGPASATDGAGTFAAGQLTAGDAVSLVAQRIAFRQDGGHGGGSASWNPTLTVHIPAAAVAGTYRGTVTHSVG